MQQGEGWKHVEARKGIARIDEENLTTHTSSLAKECDLFTIKEKDDELWSSTMAKLPENHFAFAMDASVDSLSHNANHSRWGKLSSDQCTICCKEAEQTNPSTCSQSLPSCHTIGRYCIYVQRTT